jgi:hypothetical protein
MKAVIKSGIKNAGLAALAGLVFLAAAQVREIRWIATTDNARWIDNGALGQTSWSANENYIELFPDSSFQMIEGLGCSGKAIEVSQQHMRTTHRWGSSKQSPNVAHMRTTGRRAITFSEESTSILSHGRRCFSSGTCLLTKLARVSGFAQTIRFSGTATLPSELYLLHVNMENGFSTYPVVVY